jgi:proline dehydrogenase
MAGITERLFYRIAKRWIAGYTIDDAVKSAHEANDRKILVILNRLGEHTPDRKLIEEYSQEYLQLIDAIHNDKIKGTISIKPSQLGLAIEGPLFRSLISPILERASDLGQFVWIDMENSPYTESTVSTYQDLLATHGELGMCLQANMRRTESDMAKLLPLGGKIRLVKGAYPEKREVAFKRRSEVDANYVRLLKLLFEQSEFFAVATHDSKLVNEAKRLNQDHKANFEFQLLKGIRDDLKTSLVADGFRVSEYIPYGPEWYNYSKRRMRERKRNILLLLRSITG